MEELNKRKVLLADLALLIVAFLWGGGFVAVKGGLDTMTPFFILSMRFSIATIILSIVSFKKIKTTTKEELKIGLIVGVVLFLAFATQTVGLQFTTASKQSFLTATYVVMVPFIYWAYTKNNPGKYNIIAAIICMVGIGVLTLEDGLALSSGDILTLMCAVLFAIHIVLVGRYAKEVEPVKLTILQLAVSAILSIICLGIIPSEVVPSNMDFNMMRSILYLALFSTMICYVVQNVAQKYTYSTHAALIMSFESVFGVILAVIILSEPLSSNIVFGCVLIFIAVIISETELKFLKIKSDKDDDESQNNDAQNINDVKESLNN